MKIQTMDDVDEHAEMDETSRALMSKPDDLCSSISQLLNMQLYELTINKLNFPLLMLTKTSTWNFAYNIN